MSIKYERKKKRRMVKLKKKQIKKLSQIKKKTTIKRIYIKFDRQKKLLSNIKVKKNEEW